MTVPTALYTEFFQFDLKEAEPDSVFLVLSLFHVCLDNLKSADDAESCFQALAMVDCMTSIIDTFYVDSVETHFET